LHSSAVAGRARLSFEATDIDMTALTGLAHRDKPASLAPRRSRWMALAGAVLCAFWLTLVAGGLYRIESYGQTAGQTGKIATHWPSDTALKLDFSVPTLVLFIHPHCPCSRATLGELEALLTHCQDRVAAQVVFLQPPGFSKEWVETDLWHTATRLPGAIAIRDEAGVETNRFGARVSGEALLYEVSGELLFQGGITAARGHQGDNQGRATIEALLTGRETPTNRTPVFGCSLCNCPACKSPSCDSRLSPTGEP